MDEEEAFNFHASLVTTEHFIRVFEFVDRHQWIYNFQLTKYFSEEVWKEAPEEWLSFLSSMTADELKELPFKAQWNGCPDSLQHFLETCLKLSLPRSQMNSLEPTKLNPRLIQGLTAKKQHEVTYMSSFIHHLATIDNIQHVVDIGCGLGYLDHVLAHVYGYQILGIEHSEAFAHKAEVRGSNLGCLMNNKSSGRLSTCALELKESAESGQQFESAVTSHLTPTRQPLMMIGLHCCGDLTPTMLKFFLQLETVRTLICVSCCYHKMDYDDGRQRFTNFPLSQAAQTALASSSSGSRPQTHLNIYAMRLAAQETRSRWLQQSAEEQDFHTKNVAFRGLLEILLEKHNIKPSKHGCRVTKKSDFSTAESYIEAVLLKIQITSDSQLQKLRTEFLSLCEEKKEYFDFIEPITSLQVLLQPVLESLIHLDRLAFLQEHGTKASLVPIFDEYISPRNFVLVAQK